MNLQPPDPPEHGTCPHCGSSIDAGQWLGDSCTECPKNWLWAADPDCDHDVQCAPGGGVKCTKCPGWFCY